MKGADPGEQFTRTVESPPDAPTRSIVSDESATSSLTLVPMPWLSVIVALEAFERFTLNVSDDSTSVSLLTAAATV
jgi:hypothetical protein